MAPSQRFASYAISSLYVVQLTSATLSLSQIQPISGFPGVCEGAYSLPIPSCPDASSFLDPNSSSGCDRTCFDALNSASRAIQNACRTAAAYGDTVISHAFAGDLSIFICGNEFEAGSNSVTASNVASSLGNQASTVTPASSRSATRTQSQSSASTTSVDSSTTPSSTSSSSDVLSTSTVENTSSSTSRQSTSTTIVPKSSAQSTTKSAPKPSSSHFDSTPFDQDATSSSKGTLTKFSLSASTLVASSLFVFMFTRLQFL